MGRHRLAPILLALLVALLALPALAQASGTDVIRDCYDDGHIDGNYSQSEYQSAADNLPSDVDQYGDCRDVIAQAQAAAGKNGKRAGGSGGTNGSGTSGGGSGGSGSTTGAGSRGGSARPNEGDPALETKSGAYAPNQDDKAAYDRARADAAQAGKLPGDLAIPAAGDFTPARANALPLPVMLALVAIGLVVLATTALVARKRLPALHRVADRLRRG